MFGNRISLENFPHHFDSTSTNTSRKIIYRLERSINKMFFDKMMIALEVKTHKNT